MSEDVLYSLTQARQLLQRGEFFEAHEFYEELWQSTDEGELKQAYLFAVRVCSACVHLTNENYSAQFLLQLAVQQLNEGLDLAVAFANPDEIAQNVEDLLEVVEASNRENLADIAANLQLEFLPLMPEEDDDQDMSQLEEEA